MGRMGRGTDRSPSKDWYKPLAAHLGSAYLRYSFTYGTEREVEFLFQVLQLDEGMRLLDVGMGPGRHSIEFAKRGLSVVGIDLSPEFVSEARKRAANAEVAASFFEMDAHHLPFEDEFDAVISICEGAFSLGLDDLQILRGMGRALRPGARMAVAAVNLFYVIRHMKESGELDPVSMTYSEISDVVGQDGTTRSFEMFNSCYTPRELQWIANGAKLQAEAIYGISPGEYSAAPPTMDHPELLLLASKPFDESRNGLSKT